MTLTEMLEEFRIRMDKSDTAAPTGFQDEEILSFLNDGQLQFIQLAYTKFEVDQQTTDKIRQLVLFKNYDIQPADWNGDKGCYQISIMDAAPVNYLHSLSQQVRTSNLFCRTKFSNPVQQAQIDDLPRIYQNTFRRPTISRPVSVFSDSFIELYVSDNEEIDLVSKYNLTFLHRYLRMPIYMDLVADISCELPLFTHTQIVNLAVLKAIENTNNERVNTFPQLQIASTNI